MSRGDSRGIRRAGAPNGLHSELREKTLQPFSDGARMPPVFFRGDEKGGLRAGMAKLGTCSGLEPGNQMVIKFRCPCGKVLKTPDDTSGKKAQCPNCGRLLRVPGASKPPAEPDAKPPRRPPEEAEQAPGHEKAKARVLLCESNKGDLEHAQRMLEEHGYEVIIAEDGDAAIKLARKHSPDLIVADLKMQGMSAFQICRQLTEIGNPLNKHTWQTPFIVTTPKIRGRDKQYAMSLGVGTFLEKPLSPSQLCPPVERLVSLRRGS